jgi:2-polyprenyl-6-methoxyphenol hydroxylase-like FAD-dependent oxidoreductase
VTEHATDVLIVGAGPVGLALAIDLGLRSIPCIVVEQHDRVGLNPHAKLANVRSRELLRRASPLPTTIPDPAP